MELKGTGGGGDVSNNQKKILHKGEKSEPRKKKTANRKKIARPTQLWRKNILLWKLLNTSKKYHGPSNQLR